MQLNHSTKEELHLLRLVGELNILPLSLDRFSNVHSHLAIPMGVALDY